MPAPIRAALYLRVSTSRQADNDLSIPDQRRQAKAYCTSHGWEIVTDYVEPGASATDDRRPEFQRMIDAATTKPPMFDVILVHSFSRFFRDQFQLEFYVRRLVKNGVRLVSITQELGDDPMSNMIRQIMALFDKVKKTLEIDPFQAETVRLIFRLALEGDGTSGPMGVKSITTHLKPPASVPATAGAGASTPFTRYSPGRPTLAVTASTPSSGRPASASRRPRSSR